MKPLIYLTAVAVWACIGAVSFTPAQATITAPNLRAYVGPSLTLEHCRRNYHCHWTSRGAVRTKHCHVCG
jgi:hypothetical protein